MKEVGLEDIQIIGIYIFYNLIFAGFAYPLGVLGDKLGLKNILLFGLLIFAVVYFGMAYADDLYFFLGLFCLYGIYAASTDGISKAWITNISRKEDTATAIGTYTALQSICTMIASSLAGLLWLQYGASAVFLLSAVVTLLVCLYIFFGVKNIDQNLKNQTYIRKW